MEAVIWQARGLLATERNVRRAHRLRELYQPAEVEARSQAARALAAGLDPELMIDANLGFRVFSPTSLPSVQDICRNGRSIIASAKSDDGNSLGGKNFIRVSLANDEQRLDLLRFALDRRVLAMVAAQLGTLPVISEAEYFCSFPSEGPFTKSQLWHCDDDAADVFKIFVYCEDVTANNGPFTLIDASRSRQIRDRIGYRYAGRRYRVADELMLKHVPNSAVREICGAAGTTLGVYTSRCFHQGSRIADKGLRRVAGMICYVPLTSKNLPWQLARGRAPMATFLPHFEDPWQRGALGMAIAESRSRS